MQTLRHSNSSSGFTLIEVLMAVFVLAIALTGMMRMHLNALRAQRQSSYQISATQLASDMAEMIRAWRAPGDDHPFLFDYQHGAAMPAAIDCTGGALCDPNALRLFGIAQWLQAVQAALPMARVRICRDAAPWDNSVDAAQWPCSGGAGAGIVIKLGWRAQADDTDASVAEQTPHGPQLILQVGEPAA